MRPAAQIDELALPIERHRRVIFKPGIDVLDLEILAQFVAQLQRLVARLFQPLERLVGLDDLGHLGFDLRKILFRERPRQHHVVIKPAVHRRPERQLHVGKQPHHGPGHHVGARMPHHAQGRGILFGQNPQRHFAVGRQGRIEPDNLLVDDRRYRRLRQARPDIGRHVLGPHVLRVRFNRSVGQFYLQHDG